MMEVAWLEESGWAAESARVIGCVASVRDMKAQSAWKAEAAVVTAQRKKIGGGGWFSKAILEEGHPVWIRGGVEL